MHAQKKITETDAIFKNVHNINKLADETEGVIRFSLDTKANLNIGPFSRGGNNRCGAKGADHDFAPTAILKPFGIYLPALDENYFYFTESFVTPDFMVDAIEDLWPMLKMRFDPHTIVINLDNGPENNSRRSQFIKRLTEFAFSNSVNITLAYYPPYHSKYNPIERVWGVLEKHWNGEIIDSIEKGLGLAKSMRWKGLHPVVKMVDGVYKKGITLSQKAMAILEDHLIRKPGIEKWGVDILCYED